MTYQPDYSIKYGNKYDKNRTIAEIGRAVRKDIKAAIKCGDLPEGFKTSVTTKMYSGGQSLYVRVKETPEPLFRDRTVFDPPGPNTRVLTELGERAKAVLNAIVDSYNFDGSDSMVDYFHVNFYGHVQLR